MKCSDPACVTSCWLKNVNFKAGPNIGSSGYQGIVSSNAIGSAAGFICGVGAYGDADDCNLEQIVQMSPGLITANINGSSGAYFPFTLGAVSNSPNITVGIFSWSGYLSNPSWPVTVPNQSTNAEGNCVVGTPNRWQVASGGQAVIYNKLYGIDANLIPTSFNVSADMTTMVSSDQILYQKCGSTLPTCGYSSGSYLITGISSCNIDVPIPPQNAICGNLVTNSSGRYINSSFNVQWSMIAGPGDIFCQITITGYSCVISGTSCRQVQVVSQYVPNKIIGTYTATVPGLEPQTITVS